MRVYVQYGILTCMFSFRVMRGVHMGFIELPAKRACICVGQPGRGTYSASPLSNSLPPMSCAHTC